jgi:hypothetical protein
MVGQNDSKGIFHRHARIVFAPALAGAAAVAAAFATTVLATTVLATSVAATPASAAVASDAQIKATVARGIEAFSREKGESLSKDMLATRAALSAEAATSPKARTAKALALKGFSKGALAAAEQIKSDKALTAMQYPAAQTQQELATKNHLAGAALLRQAAALLGLKLTVK